MDKIIWILSPEDYKAYAEAHPEKVQSIEDADLYGVKFRTAKPTKENRAMRRRNKKRAGD